MATGAKAAVELRLLPLGRHLGVRSSGEYYECVLRGSARNSPPLEAVTVRTREGPLLIGEALRTEAGAWRTKVTRRA
jgi:hypothetical protein